MGKKSRRKGNTQTESKGERRERLQGRREQGKELEQEDQCEVPSRPYFEGDRVWFADIRCDCSNPNTYRGFVRGVKSDSLDIVPFQSRLDGRMESWNVPVERVCPDGCEFTSRFDVGDPVICKTHLGWLPLTVNFLWPIYEMTGRLAQITIHSEVPRYKCNQYIADYDYCVKEHKSHFRFHPGAKIIFNQNKAKFVGKRPKIIRDDLWQEGVVKSVDIIGKPEYYVYECEYSGVNGKPHLAYILNDDDQHIALVDEDPRVRLFDAIAQDCTARHLTHLVELYKMDISTFLDLVIKKAVDFASFYGLIWLQNIHEVDLSSIRDHSGNNVLHQIASSKHADRFIRQLGTINYENFDIDVRLNMMKYYDSIGGWLLNELNGEKETWLHVLVRSGNVKALDAALSPKMGLAWDIASIQTFDSNFMSSLKEYTVVNGCRVMQFIIEDFDHFRLMTQAYNSLSTKLTSKEEMAIFLGDNSIVNVKKFIRFFREWEGVHQDYKQLSLNTLAAPFRDGYFELAQSLYDADKHWFRSLTFPVQRMFDQNEYIQPQQSGILSNRAGGESADHDDGDLVALCIAGPGFSNKSNDAYSKNLYLYFVRQHAQCDSAECPSLSFHLKKSVYTGRDSDVNDLIKYKINLLEDDCSLEGRLNILDHVQHEWNDMPLRVLFAIRFRQCGVLRWMVERNIVDLTTRAANFKFCNEDTLNFFFLDQGKIPLSMSLAHFLCFAAVEFDDVRSLEWICEKYGSPINSFGGFNLLHLAAFLGRIEIIVWLNGTHSWSNLVAEKCKRKPYENAFAVHVAAGQGHTIAVDLLLELGCDECDDKLQLPEHYAKKSGHNIACKWAEEREKPLGLESDVRKLLQLLRGANSTIEPLKIHVLQTKSLDVESWKDCNISSSNEPGPAQMTFSTVFTECCSHPSSAFVLWLCTWFHFKHVENFYAPNFFKDEYQHDEQKTVNRDDLISFASEYGDNWLVDLFSKQWAREITCVNPTAVNPVLEKSLSSGNLKIVYSTILRATILIELGKRAVQEMSSLLMSGGLPEDVEEFVEVYHRIHKRLDEDSMFDPDLVDESTGLKVMKEESPLKINDRVTLPYTLYHPLYSLFLRRPYELSRLYIVLAVEGHFELVKWCLLHLQGWEAHVELDIVHIAAYYSHQNLLDLFLTVRSPCTRPLLSSIGNRLMSAMIGAGAAGRFHDLLHYKSKPESLADPIEQHCVESRAGLNHSERLFEKSPLSACVRNHFCGNLDLTKCSKREINSFAQLRYSPSTVLYALELELATIGYTRDTDVRVGRFLDLLEFLTEELSIDTMQHLKQMQKYSIILMDTLNKRSCWGPSSSCIKQQKFTKRLLDWIGKLVVFGMDVQDFDTETYFEHQREFNAGILRLKEQQSIDWEKFATIKKGDTLQKVQNTINSEIMDTAMRDKGGLLLTHLAAAYDRVDVLEWLVSFKRMDLTACDGSGRTPLDVAKASKALQASKWITEMTAAKVISKFLQQNHWRMVALREQQTFFKSATTIQKLLRGVFTRGVYRSRLLYRLEESQRYSSIWARTLNHLPSSTQSLSVWSTIRSELDISTAETLESGTKFEETDQHLSKALEGALKDDDFESDLDDLRYGIEKVHPSKATTAENEINASTDEYWDRSKFQLTSHVVKFLKNGDPKYREFFVRRMRQLANGERSRILQKRLKGSRFLIFETYLEQKSGFRILWTEESCGIVIWFVAKHKSVSRLIKLIDDSKNRSASQQAPEAASTDHQIGEEPLSDAAKNIILLDVGNTPLKVYDVSFQNMDEITKASWTPRLHLTKEEKEVVESVGTVLLLGRSGTGKTVAICNKMSLDQELNKDEPFFSQLFVSRSSRLCKYVKEVVGINEQCAFTTFGDFLSWLDSSLLRMENDSKTFLPSQKMDFPRFNLFYQKLTNAGKSNALSVWKAIHTFIKGSIEAYQHPDRFLPKEDFVQVEKLGKNRCRIPSNLRDFTYSVFLQYQHFIQEEHLWDDCDRVVSLLRRLEYTKKTDLSLYEMVYRSKIYVDEIQDYTQVECLLFFYVGGPGGLFLAGDPCQSVVEGTDFRFEEVRSVGFFVAGDGHRDLIPQKPKTVNINFRSHSGILNTAAAVLELLFTYFPSSAKRLKKDHGLFRGPRPGVCSKLDLSQLAELLSNKLQGAIVLTHDESASQWKRVLNYPLVYGIREAKGLEFKTVIMLDFFLDLPTASQRPWRNLLLNREGSDFESQYPLVETHLKMLYTGVTRCIERLIFAETSSSIAGDAAVRWLTTILKMKKVEDKCDEALATIQNVSDLEAMSMTCDEWILAGVDNAEMAESTEIELEHASRLLDRSIYCFGVGMRPDLASKARAHRSSIQFRLELLSLGNMVLGKKNLVEVETKAARIIEALLSEGILGEAVFLINSLEPVISSYTSEQLQKTLVANIHKMIEISK